MPLLNNPAVVAALIASTISIGTAIFQDLSIKNKIILEARLQIFEKERANFRLKFEEYTSTIMLQLQESGDMTNSEFREFTINLDKFYHDAKLFYSSNSKLNESSKINEMINEIKRVDYAIKSLMEDGGVDLTVQSNRDLFQRAITLKTATIKAIYDQANEF